MGELQRSSVVAGTTRGHAGLIPKFSPTNKLYPEVGAGGFTRYDGTIGFYSRVDSLLRMLGERPVVLDYGAGRGAVADDPILARKALRTLRGRVGKVVGADVDPVVFTNPLLDQALLISPSGALDLPDSSVDLVVSDYTFEHVEHPEKVSCELARVLRPGGWICARTPNRWGYIGLGATLVPNRWHVTALRRLQPNKEAKDTFPTAYKLNTLRALRKWFPREQFEHHSYTWDSEATYVGYSVVGAWAFGALRSITPPQARSTLMIFLRKHGPTPDS